MKNKNTIDLTKSNFKQKRWKAFTLIELLAVIIILGILMIIAVPAVTKYITDSKKSSYVNTARNIISGASTLANSESLEMTDTDTTYYIPAKYIKTENGMKSPYGEFTEAYVGVILDDNGYRYYWTSTDSSNQGIKLITEKDNLEIDLVEGDLSDSLIKTSVETTGIEERSKIRILNLDGTWQDEKTATQNINEDGELEPVDTLKAVFITGEEFNIKAKKLAGQTNPSYNTSNTNILYFKRSKTEPSDNHKQVENIVSTEDSEVPIYLWFDNGILYWWSEDIKANLNEDAGYMFCNFEAVKDIELKYIKTDLTKGFYCFFDSCFNLESIDTKRIDTSSAEYMAYMFYGLEKIKKLDLSSFDTSNVVDMYGMFSNAVSLEEIDLSSFDTSKVTDMGYMFFYTLNLKKLDLRNFDTSNVIYMNEMFFYMPSIKTLDLSSFNTSNVTTMKNFAASCDQLERINISSFNTSKVTTMYSMFDGNPNLRTIDVSSFDTSKVTNMAYMFSCDRDETCHLSNITGLENFNTSNVTDMRYMFFNQPDLRTLDLSSFNTVKTKNTKGMFAATNLERIYASSNFTTASITTSDNMFNKTASGYSSSPDYVLTGGRGTRYDGVHIDKEYARLDDPNNGRPGYFTAK